MLFHEIYGDYYNAVAKLISLAINNELTDEKMNNVVKEITFSESFMTIIPAIKNQQWQLIDENFNTPIKKIPSRPLTLLEKRWLKAISLDPKMKLFDLSFEKIEDIKPLFTPDDYVIFDKYNDGDNFNDENYIKIFRTILKAINENRKIKVLYKGKKGNLKDYICIPVKLQYSEKDDKFRLLVSGNRYADFLNLNRIAECELLEKHDCEKKFNHYDKKYFFVFELYDGRNALERVMLHFAHFQKEAEKIDERTYRVKIYYSKSDETELVINILSFGPHVKVIEPEGFVNLIKDRLRLQKSCGLK